MTEFCTGQTLMRKPGNLTFGFKNPRVLMIAPAYAPNFFSEALVNSKLALAMVRAEWDLTVLTAQSTQYAYSKGWQEPWETLRATRFEVAPRTNKWRKHADRARALARGADPIPCATWAVETADLALRMHRERAFDFILTRSTSCAAHLPAILFRKRVRIPWIANYNDPPAFLKPDCYAEQRSQIFRSLFMRYLRRSARMADWCSFPSRRLRDYLVQALQITNPAKAIVLPHISLELPDLRQRATASLDGSGFVVTHAGNLMAEHEPVELFTAWAQFVSANKAARPRMRVIGYVHESVRRLLDSLNLGGSVVLEGPMPFLETLSALAQSDALLMVDCRHHGTLMLSKIPDYAEIGRPIIAVAPADSTTRDMIEGCRAGQWANNTSVEDIVAAFERTLRLMRAPAHQLSTQRLREAVSPARILGQLLALAEAGATTASDRKRRLSANGSQGSYLP